MNYAVLADLNSTKANCTSFLAALKKLDGNVVYCKFYSYNPKRDCGYSRYIRSAGADVAVPLYNRKKARIDMRQVIDAVNIACTNKSVDAFFIVCAPVDNTCLLTFLKGAGKYVVLGGDGEPSYAGGFDRFLPLERVLPAQDELEKKSGALSDEEKTAEKFGLRRIDKPAEEGIAFAPAPEENALRGGKTQEEFLPYTGIMGGGEAMHAVKQRLDEILNAKAAAQTEDALDEKDVEKLLKKYF